MSLKTSSDMAGCCNMLLFLLQTYPQLCVDFVDKPHVFLLHPTIRIAEVASRNNLALSRRSPGSPDSKQRVMPFSTSRGISAYPAFTWIIFASSTPTIWCPQAMIILSLYSSFYHRESQSIIDISLPYTSIPQLKLV